MRLCLLKQVCSKSVRGRAERSTPSTGSGQGAPTSFAHNLLKQEAGQTLVYVTLALTVLLALVALAIDVGFAYSTRRHMQNAADAGAQAICRGEGADGARGRAQVCHCQ